jgi:hypothetical protein
LEILAGPSFPLSLEKKPGIVARVDLKVTFNGGGYFAYGILFTTRMSYVKREMIDGEETGRSMRLHSSWNVLNYAQLPIRSS